MNHNKDILKKHGKILTNLTLMITENDCLMPDVKGKNYYPHMSNDFIFCLEMRCRDNKVKLY